jgi:hypothetical protein
MYKTPTSPPAAFAEGELQNAKRFVLESFAFKRGGRRVGVLQH